MDSLLGSASFVIIYTVLWSLALFIAKTRIRNEARKPEYDWAVVYLDDAGTFEKE